MTKTTKGPGKTIAPRYNPGTFYLRVGKKCHYLLPILSSCIILLTFAYILCSPVSKVLQTACACLCLKFGSADFSRCEWKGKRNFLVCGRGGDSCVSKDKFGKLRRLSTNDVTHLVLGPSALD